ncbi:hypothetical protein CRYUN_Cryun35bG0086100 [Craigia yunnanensis]
MLDVAKPYPLSERAHAGMEECNIPDHARVLSVAGPDTHGPTCPLPPLSSREIQTLIVSHPMAISRPRMSETRTAEAATCNFMELSPCLDAIMSSRPPSDICCSRLREQMPCLCVFLTDPSLQQFLNDPNTERVAIDCGVVYPNCLHN